MNTRRTPVVCIRFSALLMFGVFGGLIVCQLGCGKGKSEKSDNDPTRVLDVGERHIRERNRKDPKPFVEPVRETDDLHTMELPELIENLGHVDLERRYEAAELITEGGAEHLDELISALENENYHVRAGAAFTLGTLGADASPALDALNKVKENDEWSAARDAAAFAMEAIKEKVNSSK